MLMYYIDDSNLQNCPYAKVNLRNEVYSILDSGTQISVLSEEII
jgi:hypothetical protein